MTNTHSVTETRRIAAEKTDAVFSDMDRHAAENFFSRRGFSTRTIHALVARGVHIPEEVLLLTNEQVEHIAGLDADGLTEVKAYRNRFLAAPPLEPATANRR